MVEKVVRFAATTRSERLGVDVREVKRGYGMLQGVEEHERYLYFVESMHASPFWDLRNDRPAIRIHVVGGTSMIDP